jgi:hypothetical protein
VCPIFFSNRIRKIKSPDTAWLFSSPNKPVPVRVLPVCNDGDNYLIGGQEVAAYFRIKVPTAVKIEYIGDKWCFELTILWTYVAKDRKCLPEVQPLPAVGSDVESVASNTIQED